MEHTVKFNWNRISQPEKIFVKENAMKLLASGVGPAEDASLLHIKDALSRIIVEMIKREWPQQWTTLLPELFEVCAKGVSQTELVALVFLRLVEDVALLQTIESNTRRKDIYQALTVNMREIFDLFIRLIELHVSEFRGAQATGDGSKAQGHSRVVQVVLLALSSFVEWVSIQHVMESNGKLLQILCILLNDAEFQMAAADCLIQITNRKGVVKDRKPLLYLFRDETMRYMYQSATHMELWTDARHYQFLKKLTQIFCGLSAQITAIWGKEADEEAAQSIAEPPNFQTFLEIVLSFARHPSLNVTFGAASIWIQLLKHDAISKHRLFVHCIPSMIETIGPKIKKMPYPRTRAASTGKLQLTPECFASLDYDSEEEYLVFVARMRTDLLEIFRQSTLICPLVTFAYCEHWLLQRLRSAGAEKFATQCSILDPIYLEWEAIVAVIDAVLSRILLVTERPNVLTGLALLEECLKVESNDPLIQSILMSCISSLFVFLSMSSAGNVALTGAQLLPRVLEKIFSCFLFPAAPQEQTVRSVAIKNLRRHAASSFVKIALKYPLLLLPIFDQISVTVQSLGSPDNQLTNMEKIMLQEALLIISNHFCDFERQTLFIGEVLRPTLALWAEIAAQLKTPEDFMRYIGLSEADASPQRTYQNRCNVTRALNTVLGVVKRCNCPDDPDKAYRGGFIVAQTESGNPITRNPATIHVVALLPHILALLRVLNQLWLPSAQASVAKDFHKANGLTDNEAKNLLGIVYALPDPLDPVTHSKQKTPFDYMQTFLNTTFESCYHLMGAAGMSLGRDLYALPGLANALIGSSFDSLENVPDFRLRTIVRVFLRPFVYSCPTAFYDDVLVPIFAHVAPFSK